MLSEQFFNPQAIWYRSSLNELRMLDAYYARKGVPLITPSTEELIQYALGMENAPLYTLPTQQAINEDASFIIQADDHIVFSKVFGPVDILQSIVLTHYHGFPSQGLASAKIRPTVRSQKNLEEQIQHQLKPLAHHGIVLTELQRTPYKVRT